MQHTAITDILQQSWKVRCIGCAIGSGDMTPPGGVIAENESCYMHQDPEVPLKGFLIVASRRHVQSLADFTDAEYADFASLFRLGRNAMRAIPELLSITIIQEEGSGHFHLWLFPWYQWMIDKHGPMSLALIRTIMNSLREEDTTQRGTQEILETVESLRQEIDRTD